jgi:hypothetical protein
MGTTVPFPAAPAPVPAPEFHRKRWIAAIIIVFILGVLLGWWLHKCPNKSPNDGGAGAANVGPGGPSPNGPGSPEKVTPGGGTGAGGGGGGAAGNTTGGGGGGGNGGGDADSRSGNSPDGAGGTATYTPGAGASGQSPDGTLMGKLGGADSPGDAKVESGVMDPDPRPVLTAKDFSYDSTGLPRYSSGVTDIASGVATDTIRHRKSTLAVIATNDSFDSVVTWYKSQVPAGWKAESMGDLGAVAKAMSPDAIMGMISGATNGKPVDTAAMSAAIKGSGDHSVAIFNPPNQTADPRSIMIVKDKGKPTKVMMSKKLQQ